MSHIRIHSVDALRGFAVMAILLIHNVEHFIFPVYPVSEPDWLAALDKSVFDVTFFLFAGKAYAIFALLFGFTFYIQNHNQQKAGHDFGYRFMWRLLLLAGFACLNAAFFPGGDVLLLFTVVGGVLVIVRHWKTKNVAILAVLLLLQPVEWIYLLMLAFVPGFHIPDLHVGELYAEVGSVVKTGNFWDFIMCNIGVGQKASLFWAIDAGRFMQTAGLFLLGFILGRKQLFVLSDEHLRFWKRMSIAAFAVFLPLYFIHAQLAVVENASCKLLAIIFDMWQKLSFAFVLISAFMLLYGKTSFGHHSHLLQNYGKMSLTNYVSQSVIGVLIYFPIGLYLAPYCGYTISLFIGIGVFVLQLAFTQWWLSAHRQGPLEAFWHRLTWLHSTR